ncbi:STP1 protein [Plasmodium ovale curtisi]|uniref:STP1 protein n=1 Tax=Plasmodium ovale curtisi TaxID=864141 RepID=A0A1A8WKC3_PLAOA|nr:STP1 protein [Plasmodium ovale curtisi]
MADDSEYTTITHGIHIGVFLDMIEGNIKNLIRKYGHKNCGLRHEELCEEIKKIISDNRKIVFKHMNQAGRKKWISDWDSKRNEFFNRLFEEEEFINMCVPKKKFTNNPSLNQLLSKHIDFCKKKDERLSALRNKSEYNACKQYNMWIDAQRTAFTNEYLNNVKVFKRPAVNKYFSTKEHPEGHDPLKTYLNSKLNCNLYNPPPRSHPKGPVEKAPTISLHSPAPPDLDQKSQGRGGKSILGGDGGDGGAEKGKSDVNMPPKPEPPASDSLTSPQTKIKVDSTDNGQNADLKAKGTDLLSKDQGAKGKPNERTDTKAQSPEQLSEPKSSISSKDSPLAIVPDPLPSVIKDQGTSSNSTPITTSTTSGTTHSNQNLSSPSASDLSLVQTRPPAIAAVPSQHQIPAIAQNSKETTPPDSAGKLADQDVSLISSLDPGLAPSQAVNSNSSASETSSTTTSITTSSTMTLSPGSSLAPDPHVPTPSTQSIVTTSVATTLTQTTTSVSGPPTVTVSTMNTNPITSIIEITSTKGGSGEPNALSKTITNSQDLNIASPKNQDDALPTNSGVQFPDAPSSYTSANLNNILLPVPSSDSPTDLHSSVSPGGSAPVHPASHVVTTPDSNQIMTSPKDASQQSKDSTQVSSTSLPTGTQPSDKSIITLTKFPPLISIIPTIVTILATITLLFQLYKYTPFGFLLGRRRKRKKQDLRRIFEIPEKPAYESPNITVHEWEDHNLVGQTKENDVFIKLLKINKYKQEMKKRKKKNKKTLIEVHMEVLEESKNNEWELHKRDFLEICLHGFINEESDTYSKLPNSELTVNNTNKHKTIENIQKQDILWNNWIENHRNILEQWKEKEWFHILKNKWRNEQRKYKEKNNKLQENILNEQETYSIVSQKGIWKQWISKQATLIDLFNKEDWFKSIVYVQDKEKDNYHINEYNNISVTSKNGLKNEKMNHEQGRSKNIIQKLMVQIHMMVLEECIKEDIIKHKELCIDNFIEDIQNQNNYDEKRNIPQCDTHDFDVPEYEEIHISRNK